MAGRVLRDSRGRYAGSTRGWGSGRTTHGGGFGGGIKGKTRSVRTHRLIKAGKAVGVPLATTLVGQAIGVAALSRGVSPNRIAVIGFGAAAGYTVAKRIVKTATVPRR